MQQAPHMRPEHNSFGAQQQNMFSPGSGAGDEDFGQMLPDQGNSGFQY